MAEGQRMTAAERAVETMLGSDHVDVIRESVAAMVAELMEAEVAAMVGAEHGERAPESRSVQRNGCRALHVRTGGLIDFRSIFGLGGAVHVGSEDGRLYALAPTG